MTVVIDATNLVLIDVANSTTGWTSSLGGLGTSSISDREGGTNLEDQASEETFEVYHTILSENYSARTIFGWQKSGGPDTETLDGFGMTLGDGTDQIAYTVGGSDNYGFFFQGWSMFRLNTADLPTNFRVVTGAEGDLTITALTQIGYAGNFPAKAAGNSNNVSFDVLRYCVNTNPALLVEGGTTGARGTWQEIATEDDDTNNAWGIVRLLVLGSKAFELNFGIQIGSLDAASFFEDSNFQVYINGDIPDAGAGISSGSMDIDIRGDSGSTNVCNFDNFLFQGLGTLSNISVSDVDVDELFWSNGQFVDIGVCSFQAQDTGNKLLTNLTWTNCGIQSLVSIDAEGLTFVGASDALGASVFSTGSVPDNQVNSTYISDGSGHAILVNPFTASLTTHNLDGYTFDGFAGQDPTLIDAQSESSYVTRFSGGTGHAVSDVITLDKGITVTVDAVSSGVVTEFTTDSTGQTGDIDTSELLSQISTTGSGILFDVTVAETNLVLGTDRIFFVSNLLNGDITVNLTNAQALNVQGSGVAFSYATDPNYTGTFTINQTVTLTVTVVDEENNPVPYASVSIQDASDDSEISAGIANNFGVYIDSTYSYSGDVAVNVVARKSSPGDTRYEAVSSPNTIINTGLNAGIGLAADDKAGLLPMVGVLRHGVQSENVNDAVVTATVNLPVGTSRKLVVAGMYYFGASDLTVSAATYDGDAMTSINSIAVGSFHEVFLYRYDIPDGDEGDKVISFTFSAAANIKAIAFTILDDVATGAPESNDTDSGALVTSNPSLALNNTTADSFSVGFGIVDDLDSPAATGATENRVRRSDLVRDGLAQSVTILIADRASSGAHNIGADFGSNGKTWVYAGASFAKN